MPADRLVDGAAALDLAAYQRLVVAFDGARLQLAHEVGLRFQRLGDNHQAARILVEAVHDAGARDVVQLRQVVQQGVEQGAAPVAVARMDDESGRLVEDEQRLVLIDDIERNVLGRRRLGPFVRRLGDADLLAAPEFVLGLGERGAGHVDAPFADPALQPAARMLRQQAGENLVETLPAAVGRNGQVETWVCAIIGAPGAVILRILLCFLVWNFHDA